MTTDKQLQETEEYVFWRPKDTPVFKRKKRGRPKKRKSTYKRKTDKRPRFKNTLKSRYSISIPKDMVEYIRSDIGRTEDDDNFIEHIAYLYFFNLITLFKKCTEYIVDIGNLGTFKFAKFPKDCNIVHREYLARTMFKHCKAVEIFWSNNPDNKEYNDH